MEPVLSLGTAPGRVGAGAPSAALAAVLFGVLLTVINVVAAYAKHH
jgi:hypothetical protein